MMEKLFKRKTLFFMVLAGFLASMIPIFIMCGYTLPFYDDYNYGYLTHLAWQDTSSLWEVLKAACEQVGITYQNWQGTFTGIFFMALTPGIFDEFFYPAGLVFLTVLICAAMLIFFKVVLVDHFKMDRYAAGIIALVITFLSLQFMISPASGLLWYNGGFYYMGFYAITLLLFSALLSSCRTEKKTTSVVLGVCAVLCAFLVGGSNFVSGLTTCFALALFAAYRGFLRKTRWLFPLLCFVTITAAFLVSVCAPGNSVRQEYFESPGAVGSIIISLGYGVKFLTLYIKLPIIFAFMVLLPLIYESAAKQKFSYRFPVIVSGITYAVFASSFTPAFYGMGGEGPDRAQNLSLMLALLMIFFNLYYWCGWLSRVGELKARFSTSHKGIRAKWVLTALLLCCCFGTMLGMVLENRDSLTSVSAVASIANGEARGFYEERLEQLDMLKNPEITDVVFERHKYKPWLLYHTNLDTNPEASVNQYTAKYYGKNSIAVKTE